MREFTTRRVETTPENPRCPNCQHMFPIEGAPEGICPKCSWNLITNRKELSEKDIRTQEMFDRGIEELYQILEEARDAAYIDSSTVAEEQVRKIMDEYKDPAETLIKAIQELLKQFRDELYAFTKDPSDKNKKKLRKTDESLIDTIKKFHTTINTIIIEFPDEGIKNHYLELGRKVTDIEEDFKKLKKILK